jgi:hypothetical protein
MLRVAVAVAAIAALVRPAPVAADPSSPPSQVAYRPPVDAPIVDPFRPPPEPWAAGNRGVDYGATPGTTVRAAADGEVVFAGEVGGSLHVVVLHADGIRTSYSFLRSIGVHRGERVVQGQAVGTSGDGLHFGARAGDAYIDPTTLFGGGPPEVHLVPDEERRPGTEGSERSGLQRFLAGVSRHLAAPAAAAVGWARDQAVAAGSAAVSLAAYGARRQVAELESRLEELRGAVDYAWDSNPAVRLARVSRAVIDWQAQRGDCSAETAVPDAPGKGHIAVLVAGLNSTSDREKQHVTGIDTTALGYAPGDTVRFSYTGGNADYDGRDTSADIRTSAFRLRQLLEAVARQHPGVPIDIIAHSQGGIVARQALAQEADGGDHRLPRINALVLLGTPNTGADLATAAVMAGHSTVGRVLETGVAVALPDQADPRGSSVHQLAETSTLLARLNATPLPPGVYVTSIGSRSDPVVPARHTRLEGAHNVVVDPGASVHAHSALPGSAQARREVALAVARRPPTCQSLGDMVSDAVTTELITDVEDGLGAAAWLAGRWVDVRARVPATHP